MRSLFTFILLSLFLITQFGCARKKSKTDSTSIDPGCEATNSCDPDPFDTGGGNDGGDDGGDDGGNTNIPTAPVVTAHGGIYNSSTNTYRVTQNTGTYTMIAEGLPANRSQALGCAEVIGASDGQCFDSSGNPLVNDSTKWYALGDEPSPFSGAFWDYNTINEEYSISFTNIEALVYAGLSFIHYYYNAETGLVSSGIRTQVDPLFYADRPTAGTFDLLGNRATVFTTSQIGQEAVFNCGLSCKVCSALVPEPAGHCSQLGHYTSMPGDPLPSGSNWVKQGDPNNPVWQIVFNSQDATDFGSNEGNEFVHYFIRGDATQADLNAGRKSRITFRVYNREL